jgi:hypothetical protein
VGQEQPFKYFDCSASRTGLKIFIWLFSKNPAIYKRSFKKTKKL